MQSFSVTVVCRLVSSNPKNQGKLDKLSENVALVGGWSVRDEAASGFELVLGVESESEVEARHLARIISFGVFLDAGWTIEDATALSSRINTDEQPYLDALGQPVS